MSEKSKVSNSDFKICPRCNKGKMKFDSDICSNCKWIKCISCDRFVLRDKTYKQCYACFKNNSKLSTTSSEEKD